MSVTFDERWWSTRQVPSKQDANPTEADTTEYKCSALAEDGTYLYAGVHNWIIRYDMSTGDAIKLGEVDYHTADNRVTYLEVDGTDLHYVVELTDTDISKDNAHRRAWGTIDLTDVETYISPPNTFYKYDKGCRVDSQETLYHNYRTGGVDMSEGIARWFTQTIGWGTPAPVKEMGIPKLLAVRSDPSEKFVAPAGQHFVHVDTDWVEAATGTPIDETDPPSIPTDYIGNYIWASRYEGDDETQTQWLGKCTNIEGDKSSKTWKIEFENPLEYFLNPVVGTTPYVYISTNSEGARAAHPNVFVPTYMEAEIGYYFDELDDRPKEDVRIERKWREDGFESFFFPDTVATASEGDKVFLEPGLHSFISSMEPEEFTNTLIQLEAFGSQVCPFYVDFNWIDSRQQYVLSDNMIVENTRQPNEYTMCGWNTVTVNGSSALWSDRSSFVTCPGNIYLYKDPATDNIYVMVNEVKQSVQPGVFTKVRIGVWNRTSSMFDEMFYDRNVYTDSPKYYPNVDTYVGHELCVIDNSVYGFRRKYQRNWTDTELIIGYAAPPQTDDAESLLPIVIPDNWVGGRAATILVRGDRTDLFTTPGVIRTNGVKKTWRISEVTTVTVQPAEDDPFTIPTWEEQVDLYTRMVVKSIRPIKNWDVPHGERPIPLTPADFTSYSDAYVKQVVFELLGETLSVAQGYDIRDEVFVIIGKEWATVKEVYFENTKELEGESDPDNPFKETQVAEIDDVWTLSPRFTVDNLRVRDVSAVKIGEQEFDITDITTDFTITIPNEETVYVKRNQGDEFDKTYIYVNQKYLDDEFEVEYTYYPTGELQQMFTDGTDIYYNYSTEDYNIWLKNHQDNWSPGVTERGIYSNVVELDSVMYAVTQPSYALRQYSKNWSEHIEEFKTNKRGWDILGQISGANDQILYEWNGVYVLKDETLRYRGSLDNIVSITREDVPPFEEVEITYKNGKYYSADTKASADDSLTYKRTLSYVSDYPHANVLGDNILTFYSSIRSKYTVVVDEYRHDVRFGDVFDVNNVRGKVVEIELLGNGVTKLILYELSTVISTSLTNENQSLI